MSLHGLLISLHAAAGTAAFSFGAVAVWRPRPLPAYLLALMACILLLAGAIAIDWGALSGGTRALYLALALLGGYMIWCGGRAFVLGRRGMARTGAYLDNLGFTLVALGDAFAVILVLRLGAPTWVIVITGVAVAAVGNRAIAARKRQLPPAPPRPATAGRYPVRTPTPSARR